MVNMYGLNQLDLSKESIRYVKTGMTLTKQQIFKIIHTITLKFKEQQENGKMLIMMKLKRYGSY